jgi:hypothetical protein
MPHGIMSEDKWPELRRLHTEGLGRNAIAREMGIEASCISRTAAHLGLTFDRSKIRAAAEARAADLEERRSLIAVQFMDIAEDSLRRIYEPTTVYSFGGKDNEYNEHTFEEAPNADRKALITAAAISVDKVLRLVPPAESSELDSAKSMLGSLGDALVRYSREQDETEGDEA